MSETEVWLPRLGELRAVDVARAFGGSSWQTDIVDVLVLAKSGAPVVARVEVAKLTFGPTSKLALLCPSCRECVELLLVERAELRCVICARKLTKRQALRSTFDWRLRGEREGDLILRLLSHPVRRLTAARLTDAERAIENLLSADQRRVNVLRERAEQVLRALEVRP